MDKDLVTVRIEEAKEALKEAIEKQDSNAAFFWSGYLLALI